MVRSLWKAAVVVGLAWTGLAWAQTSSPTQPERYMTVREEGGAPQRCKLLKTWREPNGSAAYEVQAPAIAVSKADGLRRHYGASGRATAFWDLHGRLEGDHAAWTLDALDLLAGDESAVRHAARAAAAVWWSFLDEREAAA